MNAIVFESHTGFTARYAQLLSDKLGLPCYPLAKAKMALRDEEAVLFLSWVQAGHIEKLSDARRHFSLSAIVAVGMMMPSDTARQRLRHDNRIPEKTPLFQLLGGVDLQKLKGVRKMTLSLAAKAMAKSGAKTAEEQQILYAMQHGGDLVKEENLEEILRWYRKLEKKR
ncbi:MAG: hypothetical protein PUC32_02840 [Oscillospiraceae bacterium]|nr:hypothetical protein [Oscillospiraceae bacterium]